MISELAPADLLLQRAGRLQRHKRTRLSEFTDKQTRKDKPTLWIIKPEIDEKGFPAFGKNVFVYDEHILLRSWLRLYRNDGESIEVRIPDGIEKLIEDVYDKKRECFDEKYLNLWEETKYFSDEKLAEKAVKAMSVFLTYPADDDFFNSFKRQLDEDDPEKHHTLRAHTRDEDRPTVAVVLLTQEEAKSINLTTNPDRETSEFLIKREVKISKSGLTQAILANPEFKKAAWEKSSLLRHHRLIILNENLEKVIKSFKIILDNEKGVLIK